MIRAALVRRLLEYEQMKLAAYELNATLVATSLHAQVFIEQNTVLYWPQVDLNDLKKHGQTC